MEMFRLSRLRWSSGKEHNFHILVHFILCLPGIGTVQGQYILKEGTGKVFDERLDSNFIFRIWHCICPPGKWDDRLEPVYFR
jgi:hypothetical protein